MHSSFVVVHSCANKTGCYLQNSRMQHILNACICGNYIVNI